MLAFFYQIVYSTPHNSKSRQSTNYSLQTKSMLAIKLRRIGKKHQPAYRVVVAEKLSKPKSLGVEDLGWVNTLQKKRELKSERIKYWLEKGAQPTDTVHNLLVSEGIIEGKKIPVHSQPEKSEEEAEKKVKTEASKTTNESEQEDKNAEKQQEPASTEEIKPEETKQE
ncbi:MAG: 30S ribosomal protein S16 [Candidatus Harrisonbacteria bacterium CG10_big_fil_rev_8_21_14_0_10_42_17]|uniref:Small ribosomal subunit protein bS16 n=1 Tax=Candidatus Harrisonbacteria bacterium CG10_big_fil_rev_8_21_14_0_10_42_17 TaxID=1974584 RepID=A0A2M6WGX0_9BACT|nr:MAG: 30S ribosomal protein S16 [Candidatus Harrisonbacteria bacterium CG10_big_fil_rev_8_21_14_0_10_42_17]